MEELFQVIRDSSGAGIAQSPLTIIFNLALAMALGFVYAYVYKLTYIREKKDKTMKEEMISISYALVLLSVGGAFIWIVVADNLVRAFGLAGALSLIRFRTVVKDPSNTIKVFYAIIIGMSCGLSQYYAAIIGTIFMCFVLTVIYFVVVKNKKKNKEKKENGNGDLDAEADA
jgi:preprotein translocase subunit SecY